MNYGTVMQRATIKAINNGVLEEYIMAFKDVHDVYCWLNKTDYKIPTVYSQF